MPKQKHSATRSSTASKPAKPSSDPRRPFAIHLLDVGPEEYGDAVLCEFGAVTVLIDGAHPGNNKDKGEDHPSIQRQLGELLNQEPPIRLSLLVVTHAHLDHIGCLPALVDKRLIAPEWALVADPELGWGHTSGDATLAFAGAPPGVRRLAAALREEPRKLEDDLTAEEFASDAESLETKYNRMLDQLAGQGTNVVRFGRDDHMPLVSHFDSVGLDLIGPSLKQLAHCAELIRGRSQDLMRLAADALPTVDAVDARTVRSAYNRIVELADAGHSDVVDALSKDKGAINDQSIITCFSYGGHELLFTGDMQLSEPEVSDQVVVDEIGALLAALSGKTPFSLVKLPHHGSYNGFSESVWQRLGDPVLIGMCAGSGSKRHPNPQTLQVLQAHRDVIEWVRTDRNGLVTLRFTNGAPDVEITRGEKSDPEPNSTDQPSPLEERVVPRLLTEVEAGGPVEVTARVPNRRTRVTISIEVNPGEGGGPVSGGGRESVRSLTVGGDELRLGGGRQLPPLAFVTQRERLARNIGRTEADEALRTIGASHKLIELTAAEATSAAAAAARVRRDLMSGQLPKGIVLLGGYDVVPPERLDSLPARLRRIVTSGDDADDFIVWSDDIYGDLERDRLPELPVSRIPDGRSSELVKNAIASSPENAPEPRRGIRNVARPFAEEVFRDLPGGALLLQSQPTRFDQTPAYSLDADRVYIMLHGSDTNATRYWGENGGGYPVAMDIGNVPSRKGAVAFTGCCWGALIVLPKASDVGRNTPVVYRTPDSSIALQFLLKGGLAFVGCTGSHYSPTEAPFHYFGGPIHEEFWRTYNLGTPPAEALFRAKVKYQSEIPHRGPAGGEAEAIEFKILRQYTCLGLGW